MILLYSQYNTKKQTYYGKVMMAGKSTDMEFSKIGVPLRDLCCKSLKMWIIVDNIAF